MRTPEGVTSTSGIGGGATPRERRPKVAGTVITCSDAAKEGDGFTLSISKGRRRSSESHFQRWEGIFHILCAIRNLNDENDFSVWCCLER